MQIFPGIVMLEVQSEVRGQQRMVRPTLLWDDTTAILVDTGFPGTYAQLRETIDQSGLPFKRINIIYLTHQDIDHVGNVTVIQKELPGQVKVLTHQVEADYVNGTKTPEKLAKLEANLEKSPPEVQAVFQGMKSFYQNNPIQVNQTLTDGQVLPYCGGIMVIYTPGHTQGHSCLYLPAAHTLVAGDAMTVVDGELARSPASNNYDQQIYSESLKKLARYDIGTVITYHGGLYQGEVAPRLLEIAREG